jgi:hypothetical protein
METPSMRRVGPEIGAAVGPPSQRSSIVAGPAVAPRPERRREFTPNATLAERHDQTPQVGRYVVQPDAPVPSFEPGQYFSLGLEIDGQMVVRPYSTASPRGTTESLEFLIRHVPTGTLTPSLWHASVGDRLWFGPPRGLFRLKQNDPRTHLLVSSGTGISPFMSMLGELLGGVDGPVAPPEEPQPPHPWGHESLSPTESRTNPNSRIAGVCSRWPQATRDCHTSRHCRGRTIRRTPGGLDDPVASRRSWRRSAKISGSTRRTPWPTCAATPKWWLGLRKS